VIKLIATGAVYAAGTHPGAPEYSEEEIRAAVDEAALHGLFVAAHAHGPEGALRAIRAGVRTIEHGTLIDDAAIGAMIEHGTYYVPTTFLIAWIEEHADVEGYPAGVREKTFMVRDRARQALRDAIEAGVRIAYGTDAIVFPHGMNAGQLRDFVDAGMEPIDAIRSATIIAAECLGRENDVGVLEPGRFADLVAVRGDSLMPVDRFCSVDVVMKGGTVVVP
jgi:imidazolonepropionase-like amidohydrolase